MSHAAVRLALVSLYVASAGCAATDDGDWPVPRGDDSPIHEFAFVSLEARDAPSVEIVEDTVVREESIPEPLSGSLGVAIAAGGEIAILDARAARVHVLTRDGAFLRSFGGQGQGPGELARPTSIAAVAQQFVVYDHSSNEFKVWTLEGDYVDSHRVFSRPVTLTQMAEVGEGSLIVAYLNVESDGSTSTVVGAVRLGDDTFQELLRLPYLPSVIREGGVVVRRDLEANARQPLVVVDPSESSQIYIVSSAAYRIVALALAGTPQWRVSVSAPRVPYPRERKVADSRRIEIFYPELPGGAIAFPDYLPALAPPTLLVDGHGHVYVFLESGLFGDVTQERREMGAHLVDVYSSLGHRIFSGRLEGGSWNYARGDYVYRRGRPGEDVIVTRFRIHEPF